MHHRGAQGGHDFLRAGVRPAIPLICQFITRIARSSPVAPICRALSMVGVVIAPRTYWAQVTQPVSKPVLWDTTITELASFMNPTPTAAGHPSRCMAA